MRRDFLVEIDELQSLANTQQVKIIDTRSAEAYQKGHLPGALNIPEIFTYLVTPESGGLEGLQKFFKQKLESNGIRPDDSLIIYEDAMDNGYGQSCRGRFLLNYFGHKDVRVFHGGFRAWASKGLPLVSEIPQILPSQYEMKINSEEMLTSQNILDAINDPSIYLLDCRDHAEWVGATSSPYGVDYSPRKGRIPGAHWIEWYEMMFRKDGIPWMKEEDEILKVCERNGITPDTKVYIYCFKGARASNMLLALKMSGIRNVKNYLGSWNEWALDFDLPIDESYPEF